MRIEEIEKYLEEISLGTDFSFEVKMEDSDLVLYMQGDNPEGEDWCTEFTIENPATRKELIEILYWEIRHCYEAFDIDEEVYVKLEAKMYGGVRGIPDAVSLVHNEEYKLNALEQFSAKLYMILIDERKGEEL